MVVDLSDMVGEMPEQVYEKKFGGHGFLKNHDGVV
jgi:hypothetical protein